MTDHRKRLRSEFAVMCGVSRAAITKACNEGGQLAPSFDGSSIDIAHAAARAYHLAKTGQELPDARSYGQHTRGVAAGKEKRKRETSDTLPPLEDAEHISEFLDMTLRDVIDKFGTDVRFLDWLKAVEKLEAIRDKRLRNDERENKLVPRELVGAVVGSFERCFSLQLNDASKTISARLYSYVKAGRTVEDATQLVEDQIGAPIKDAKRRIADAMREYQ